LLANSGDGLHMLSVAYRGRGDMAVWADGRLDGIGRTPRLEWEWKQLFSCSADLDIDGDVDASDFLTFSSCFNGSLHPPSPICANPLADLDEDGDADVNDFLTFSNCFNGALHPPRCP